MALLTDADLDRLALDIPHVKAWLRAVEAEIKTALEAGVEFTNVSLVPTVAQRQWLEGVDPLELLRQFSDLDQVAPRKALSPSQAEKTLGRAIYSESLAEFVGKTSSGMKLEYSHPEED